MTTTRHHHQPSSRTTTLSSTSRPPISSKTNLVLLPPIQKPHRCTSFCRALLPLFGHHHLIIITNKNSLLRHSLFLVVTCAVVHATSILLAVQHPRPPRLVLTCGSAISAFVWSIHADDHEPLHHAQSPIVDDPLHSHPTIASTKEHSPSGQDDFAAHYRT